MSALIGDQDPPGTPLPSQDQGNLGQSTTPQAPTHEEEDDLLPVPPDEALPPEEEPPDDGAFAEAGDDEASRESGLPQAPPQP